MLGRTWSSGGVCALMIAIAVSDSAGQSLTQVAAAPVFAPGGQELFLLDVAATRGTFPRGVSRLSGNLEWVTKDGRLMLRATERSELLIALPVGQRLPQNFTIEVDLISRDGGPEPDLRLEGTRFINQDVGSAHLEMTMDASFGTIYIIGGGSNISEFPIPDNVRATLPESFTRVGVSVEGGTIRFFINGVEMLPDPNQPAKKVQAQFARGEVLRVTLGGLTDDSVTVRPVYLARVRLATGAPAVVATAIPASTTGTITPIATTATMIPVAAPAATATPVAGTSTPTSVALSPRTITLTGFTAVGDFSNLPARIIAIPELSATGVFGSLPARSISIPGFTATGAFASLAPRTVTIPGYTAVGLFGSLGPRTITIPGFTASGFGSLAPRAITISGFAAVGLFASLTPRTITLPAFTAVGYGSLPPRTVTIAGFTAAGVFTTLPPRTITLPGFTAVRIP